MPGQVRTLEITDSKNVDTTSVHKQKGSRSDVKPWTEPAPFVGVQINGSTTTGGFMKLMSSVLALGAFLTVSVVAQEKPFLSPIEGKSVADITKDYGPAFHPLLKITRQHNGIDIPVPLGTDVFATADGTVTNVGEATGYGILVRIRHSNGYETLYAHLSGYVVKVGEKVKAGTKIARSGNSGQSSEPHLHYEVIKNGKNLDPKNYFASK